MNFNLFKVHIMNCNTLKGNVMSLKLDFRLHIHPVGMNTQSGSEAILKVLGKSVGG